MSAYAIEGPAVISFSGGRTSAYMLRQILDAGLQSDVHVLFENTGKECSETFDFVVEVAERWGVKVHWLERVAAADGWLDRAVARFERKQRGHPLAAAADEENEPPPLIREVHFSSASREGEPFDRLLAEREAYCSAIKEPFYLPGWGARYCTVALKTDVMRAWMLARGHDEWVNVVGIRYDEPKRWSKYLGKKKKEWDYALPLYEAKVTKRHHIRPFWAQQPFDPKLEDWEGNCDLCHLKTIKSKVRIMRERPDRAQWWLDHETRTGKTFRLDHAPLSTLQRLDQSQADLFNDPEAACGCDLEAA